MSLSDVLPSLVCSTSPKARISVVPDHAGPPYVMNSCRDPTLLPLLLTWSYRTCLRRPDQELMLHDCTLISARFPGLCEARSATVAQPAAANNIAHHGLSYAASLASSTSLLRFDDCSHMLSRKDDCESRPSLLYTNAEICRVE